MEWVRGDTIGSGSFGTVNLVVPKNGCSKSPLTAVKSCEVIDSVSLKNEKEVLDRIGSCPQVIRCFGDNYTVEKGVKVYNLFLEYASKGSLADEVKKSGGKLPESDVKRYGKSILKGLRFLHSKGFVHCDIKLPNVLLFCNGDVKLADFGLAKRNGGKQGMEIRGTPFNLAPESVNENSYDSPVDIWAFGCAIVEMFTGKPAWNFEPGTNMAGLLIKIGVSDELPGIPLELSEEGKDFLGKCFVKDPKNRWTAEMLLDHPFMADDEIISLNRCQEEEESISSSFEDFSASPRCPFDFPDWVSTESTVSSYVSSGLDRIRELVCDEVPNWLVSENWMTLR